MAIDQKAKLKRILELIGLIEQELESKEQREYESKIKAESKIPLNSKNKRIISEISGLVNSENFKYVDLSRLDELLDELREPLNNQPETMMEKYETELKKLGNSYYGLSSEYINAAPVGWFSDEDIPKAKKYNKTHREVALSEARKQFKTAMGNKDIKKKFKLLRYIVREDGLYGPEHWIKYRVGNGIYGYNELNEVEEGSNFNESPIQEKKRPTPDCSDEDVLSLLSANSYTSFEEIADKLKEKSNIPRYKIRDVISKLSKEEHVIGQENGREVGIGSYVSCSSEWRLIA